MSTPRRITSVFLLFLALAGLAGPAWGVSYLLPGTIYDQDKHHNDGGWCNWYNDPDNNGYQPGDPINNTYNSTTAQPGWRRETDLSCWMAAAANMLRYVGGPDMYQTWAYDQGVWYDGAVRYWNHGGATAAPITAYGLDAYSDSTDIQMNGEPTNDWPNPNIVVSMISDSLAHAMPIGISVNWSGSAAHAVMVVGLDISQQTITICDSDDGTQNNTDTYHYGISGSQIWLDNYGGTAKIYKYTRFGVLSWLGAGTLGDTSTSGDTTLWSKWSNWQSDYEHFRQVEFTNPGLVQIDASTTGLKFVVKGDLTTLDILPTGSLTWEMMQNSGAHINMKGGTLVVHQDFFHSGTLAIGPNSIFGAGNVYMGTTFSGAGAITQTGGTASVSTIVVGQDLMGLGVSNLTIQGGQFSAGNVTIGQKGIGNLMIQGGQFSAVNLTVGQTEMWGSYVQQGGTANVTDVITFASDPHSLGSGALSGGNLTGNAMVLGNAGNGYWTHTGGKLKLSGLLVLGEQGGSSGRYLLGGSGQLEADSLIVGNGGAGTFEQDVLGSVSVNVLQVAAGSTSTYTMKTGTLWAGSISIGLCSVGGGIFTQNQGLATVTGDLRLATSSTASSGTYTMTSGTLSVQENIYVGDKGAGSFTQTGGAVQVVNGTLNVGNEVGSSGHYTLNPGIDGGTVSAHRLVLRSSSIFDHYNGSVDLVSNLMLMGTSNCSPIYRLSYGTLSATHEYIGDQTWVGTFEQTGGTNNVSVNLTVGLNPSSTSTYTISGNSNLTVGYNISISGELNLNGGVVAADRLNLLPGGVVNSSGSPTLKVNLLENVPADFTFNGNLYFGHSGGSSSASYAVASGGSLAVSESLMLGFDALATFTQTGGSVTSGLLTVGQLSTYNLSGPASLLTTGEEFVGRSGVGNFNQLAGSHTVNGPLHVADSPSGVGNFSLHGGSLVAAELDLAEESSTVATFIQDGGQSTFANGMKVARFKSTAHGVYQLLQGTLSSSGTEYIGETGLGEFYQFGGTHSLLVPPEMYIGYNQSATGKYAISGGSLDVGNGKIFVGHNGHGTLQVSGTGLVVVDELVLSSGTGTFTSTGGTLRVNKLTGFGNFPSFGCSLQIGHAGGDGLGSYAIASGQSLSAHDLTVGYDALGFFSHNGGSNTITAYLVLGNQAGGQGAYTLGSTGSVSVSATYQRIGSHGSGTFTHNNGNNTVSANLYLGQFANSQGTYNLNGGNLTAHDITVGCQGTGTMSQTAGTTTIANYLVLGEQAGGQGSYTLGGTGSVSAPYQRIGCNGSGTFTQNAGGNTASLNMYVGEFAGSHGIYNLNGGSLSVGEMNIGLGDTGALNWNDGALSAGSVWIYAHGTMTCGQNWTYDKMLEVRGGTLDLSGHVFALQSFSPAPAANGEMTDGQIRARDAYIGSMGQATFTQSGGNFSVNDSLSVAAGPAATGHFTLNGGTVTATDETVAYQGTGSMVHTAGTNRVFAVLSLGRISGSNGTYEMNGTDATLTATNVRVGNGGTGHFTQTLGNVSITGTLSLGYESTGSGTYELGPAGLQADAVRIGVSGFGTLTQHNGVNTVGAGGLTLGNQPFSMGRYELSGGSLTVAGPTIIQGRGERGDHRIVQTGGQAHYNGSLVISDQPWFGSSRYELRGGKAWVTGDLACNAQGHILLGGTMGVMAVSNKLLLSGGGLDVELAADGAVSFLTVNAQGAGAVNLANPSLNLSLAGGYTPGASAYTWTLIDPTGDSATITGTFAGLAEGATFTLGGRVFTLSYLGGQQHNDLVLSTAALPSANAVWMGLVSNSWGNPSNWDPGSGVPDWTGTSVTFGGPQSNPTVDLEDTGRTVGHITFNSSVPTTIQGSMPTPTNGGGTLTLDNNTAAPVMVTGSHTISAPVCLKSNAEFTVNTGSELDVSGNIGDAGLSHSLTKLGDGMLILRGENSYGGGTDVEAGTLQVCAVNALPPDGALTIGAGGTVVLAGGLSAAGTFASQGNAAAVPEPSTLALVLVGVAALAVAAWWRRRIAN